MHPMRRIFTLNRLIPLRHVTRIPVGIQRNKGILYARCLCHGFKQPVGFEYAGTDERDRLNAINRAHREHNLLSPTCCGPLYILPTKCRRGKVKIVH